jgi:hypothetical protein
VHPLPCVPVPVPYVLSIPMDDVELSDDGRYRIQIDGEPHVVAYHVELDCWFLLKPSPMGHLLAEPVWRTRPGQWHVGNPDTFSQRPSLGVNRRSEIVLPPVTPLTPNAQPLPRTIHYVWIGEVGVPEALVETMSNNVRRCPGYRMMLHAHASTPAGWQRLQEQFPPQSGIELIDLGGESHFDAFQQSTLGKFYQYFIGEAGRNYGAASDILRVYLLHREGGIYMDVDDQLAHPLAADLTLSAGLDDLLLNTMVDVKQYAFHGYSNNNFACHAGNPVLAEMLREMERRLSAEESLFLKPRPWRKSQDGGSRAEREEMLVYILSIFRLTGPDLFNDVVRALRPDYYLLEEAMLNAYGKLTMSPSEPLYVAEDYFDRMHAAKALYLPFSELPFKVKVGSAHSWNPVRPSAV